MAMSPKKPVRMAATAKKTVPPPSIQELEARVRQRAYELYLERGRVEGHEAEDWIRAEAEVAAGKSRKSRRK